MLMINQSFIQLIENYKKNNKDVDLVRKYLLSNVYELDNLNEYIAYCVILAFMIRQEKC